MKLNHSPRSEFSLTRLPLQFYDRDTHEVAKDLLGKLLVRKTSGQDIGVRIVEVESYVGVNDKACHASKGRTARTSVMFGKPGRAYIYLIYGMYHCLNVVTEREGMPAAVLIRAAEPVFGLDLMTRRADDPFPTRGPGKLTKAMGITREQNELDLTSESGLFIADDYALPRIEIQSSPRIGVDYAEEDALLPWRYYLVGSNHVSGKDARLRAQADKREK